MIVLLEENGGFVVVNMNLVLVPCINPACLLFAHEASDFIDEARMRHLINEVESSSAFDWVLFRDTKLGQDELLHPV